MLVGMRLAFRVHAASQRAVAGLGPAGTQVNRPEESNRPVCADHNLILLAGSPWGFNEVFQNAKKIV